MAILFNILLVVCSTSTVLAAIAGDFNCTTLKAGAFVYAPSAFVCENTLSDSACNVFYKAVSTATPPLLPAVDNSEERPLACYTEGSANTAPFSAAMKQAALNNCPKTCGFCCQTSAYSCPDAQFPSMKCNTITASQCRSPLWRVPIAKDCPSACGFCNEGGCVDGVLDCANDLSICNAVGMQDFVNQYCQKTCNRCASSPSVPSGGTTCTSYNRDSSTACAAWAVNGFCTNDFYTPAQRKSYCATTCRIC